MKTFLTAIISGTSGSFRFWTSRLFLAAILVVVVVRTAPLLIGYADYNLGNLQFLKFYTNRDRDPDSAFVSLRVAHVLMQRSGYYLPSTYAVLARGGEISYLLGDWESGDRAWHQALRLNERRTLSESQQRLKSLFLARQAREQGDTADAIRYLRTALTCGLPELGDIVYEEYEQELERALAVYFEHRWLSEGQAKWALKAAKYYWRTGEYIRAFELAVAALNTGELSLAPKGEALLLEAMGMESRGDLQTAVALYEHALSYNPRLVEAYLRLIELSKRIGDFEQAALWTQRLERLEPLYDVNQTLPLRGGMFRRSAGDGPGEWLWAEIPVAERWTLMGYDIDEDLLEDGTRVPVTLFWRLPAGTTPEGENWHQAGDHWLQIVEAVNLVPNAGFEWDMPADKVLPTGFPFLSYPGQSLANQAIGVTERADQRTQVLELKNTNGVTTVGLRSLGCEVTDGFYLQGGWLRTIDARANLGRYWLGSNLSYDYVVSPHSSSLPQWTHWAAITRPAPDAQKIQVFLLSWNNSGRVQFDNLVMFKLEGVPWPPNPMTEQK